MCQPYIESAIALSDIPLSLLLWHMWGKYWSDHGLTDGWSGSYAPAFIKTRQMQLGA